MPIGVRVRMIHGTADAIVPFSASDHYQSAARAAGDASVELSPIEGGDHFDLIDPTSSKWNAVQAAILGAI